MSCVIKSILFLHHKTKLVEKTMDVLTKEEIIKEEFLTAAQKLFQQYGFQKTTMEDIAKAIGKGKSTLYYYYKSKSEVFQDVIIREADEVINSVFEATQKASSAVEKLQIYLQFSFDTLKSKVNLYGVMKEEVFKQGDVSFYRPSMIETLKEYSKRENQIVKDILLLGVEKKEFTAEIKENIDLVSCVVIASIRGVAIDLFFNEREDANLSRKEDKVNVLLNLLQRGLKA